jgi:Ca2+-binding EF-hand superfamily protein
MKSCAMLESFLKSQACSSRYGDNEPQKSPSSSWLCRLAAAAVVVSSAAGVPAAATSRAEADVNELAAKIASGEIAGVITSAPTCTDDGLEGAPLIITTPVRIDGVDVILETVVPARGPPFNGAQVQGEQKLLDVDLRRLWLPLSRHGEQVLAELLKKCPAAPKRDANRKSAAAIIAMWDSDHDGTLDRAELNKAAATEFAKLDVDHDGTVDAKELGQRVTQAEFLAADKDRDGTLDQSEYQSIVTERFRAANPDNDATIEAKELQTPAGHRLIELLE